MNAQRLIIAGLALAAICLAAFAYFAPGLAKPTLLSGYIEGEPLYLAAPIAGTLTRVDVMRGQDVTAGQPLFVVDTSTLAAQGLEASGQVAQATASIAAAQAARDAAAAQVGVAEANAAEADTEAARVDRLAAMGHGAVSQDEVDKDRAAAAVAHAQLDAARKQAAGAAAQVGQAQGQFGQAQGVKADAGARLGQASPVAPAAARVEDVFFQVGEWAAANQPVVALLPDNRVRLRFFAPETQVAHYRVGRQVRFSCDGCATGLTATINYVSPRPEFTPPVIYSLQSRDRLVFLVEAMPVDPRGLTPGLPADVTPLGP